MKAEQRILKVLGDYPQDGCWGYDILRLARVRSGRMYPILARLETAGVVVSWWVGEPRRRRYRLVSEPVDNDITRKRIPLSPALALVLRMAA
jgi:hypothetical protein